MKKIHKRGVNQGEVSNPQTQIYIHAATRETEQEAGLIVVPNYFIGIYTTLSKNRNVIHIVAVSADIQSGCFRTKRDEEIGEVKPYTLEDLRLLERDGKLRTGHYNIRVVEDFIRQRERKELVLVEKAIIQIR